ncbi:hypothetical protein [Clostridium sp. C2-6-12]|uniref:hypothetical protein n=1 Tax=Clostridium sp. C2-6-12 TaxID=2698832 RepID=UPI00136D5C10|nr:hypothetical protein [Clostridium sp. C2-6-12]
MKINDEQIISHNITYNVYLCFNHADEKFNCASNIIVWKSLIQLIVHKAKFVEFSCIEDEKDLIEEIYSNIKEAKEIYNWRKSAEELNISHDIAHQIAIRGEMVPNTAKLILNDCLVDENRIKWFYINLLKEDDDCSVIFAVNHNCSEYYLNYVTEEELIYINKIAEDNNLFIRID